MYNDYSLNSEQIKTIKDVEAAMKTAAKMGVGFWDDYGTLTAFNSNEIELPVPDKGIGPILNRNHVYTLKVKNFFAGNADDELYVKWK